MKFEKFLRRGILPVLLLCVLLVCASCGKSQQIVLDGELADGAVIEYTGQKIQFPVAYVANQNGGIVSYNVEYKVISLADQSEMVDEYASFDLKTGEYELVYSFKDDPNVKKVVPFSVKDTTSPAIEFLDIPNGLFLQDITGDTVNKLPLYSLSDASSAEGIDLKQVLKFKGEKDEDFKEYPYRQINNSYEISEFGTFYYELTATDIYGNTNAVSCYWKVKDRTWKPEQLPADGFLADYANEGYCNLVEGGDANQYYKIGNDYSDEWLEEFEGAKGVLKMDLSFNDAAGYGNNTIRLRLPKTFTQKDLEGKYLAVRIYVEGDHIKDTFLFAGNNVEFREEDSTTRAFSTSVSGLEMGKWQTFYIAADTAEHIGIYPNATYNPSTTFYHGGDPADALQLCFHREPGYFENMILYVDSVSIADFLPNPEVTISGNEAAWTSVEGAEGYLVNLNGTESVTQETKMTLNGQKGYIRVTAMGNGATTLDSQPVTAVYGLDVGDALAKFDDELYIDLFNDQLKFSSDAEHNGYRATSLTGTLTEDGVKMDIGTGAWGVVSGVRFQFPYAAKKGGNTTLILNMQVSNADFGQIRVYDYSGKQLGVLKLDSTNTGKFHSFEVDISAYYGKLEGIQLIFGPNSSFTSVSGGVSITFREISLKNTYYSITVDGQKMLCAGSKPLNVGYTNPDVVQFTTFFNFGVPANDTPLGFSGKVMLDGKPQSGSAVVVVGYPNTDTICFKLPHSGKVLTIMKDSVIYYNGIAVKVANTFNATWNGSGWHVLSQIPEEPEKEFVTLADGTTRELVDTLVLTPGYTMDSLVQFPNVYDFGAPADSTPIGFEGTVLLQGVKVENPSFNAYLNSTTVGLEKINHKDKVVTIMEGSVIYNDTVAVRVKTTFNAIWDGTGWTNVDEIPEPPEPQEGSLTFAYRYGAANLIQLNTNLPASIPCANFLATDNGCQLDQSANKYQQIGWIAMENVGGKIVLTFHFNSSFSAGQTYILGAGSVFAFTDGSRFTLDETYTFTYDGSVWTIATGEPEAPEPTEPEPTEPTEPEAPQGKALTFQYRYGAKNLIQVNTNLPAATPCVNFLATDNGCQIDQSANKYQQVGWIGMENVSGKIVLTFHFNNSFSAGQTYVLGAGSVFAFTDGSKYTLDKDYTFTFGGNSWTMTAAEPAEPEEPQPTQPEEPHENVLTFQYRYGEKNFIQVNTDLPATTPCVNFLTTDNGCQIDQSGNQYQQIGWIGMENVSGKIVLTFHFNKDFLAGQTYYLPAKAVFGFTDGSSYQLDKNYTFTFDAKGWTMVAEEPEETEEPDENALNFQFRYGTADVIQVNTNLPATTPVANFLTTDNGCQIDQSGNQYQQIGWIQMHNPAETGGVMVLTFHFNSKFKAGQTFFLPKGAVFGFADGSKYILDKDYTFTFDGSSWTVSKS